MSNEELIKAIQEGTKDYREGMEQLYNQNVRLIYKVAYKYMAYMEIDDLMQEAYFGLCKAVEHYKFDKGMQFSSYVCKWIKQSIFRYIENNSNAIRIPSYRHGLLLKYRKLLDHFEREHGRRPNTSEIAAKLNISIDQVEDIKNDYRKMNVNMGSLEEQLPGDSDARTFMDTLISDISTEDTAVDNMIGNRFEEEFWSLISDRLDEQESRYITEKYRNGCTTKEINEIFAKNETDEKLATNKCRAMQWRILYKLKKSDLASVLNDRFEIAIGKAYAGTFWKDNMMYTPTEAAAFKDMGIKI